VQERYLDTIRDADILPGTGDEDKRIKELVVLNQSWFMQTLLDRKDRMSMYNGLEVRVPFCDHRIAEYLYGVPWEYKNYMGREKGLLRYAVRDILPKEIVESKKSPYPKTYDPNYLKLVTDALQKIIADEKEPIHQIVSKSALETVLQEEHTWPWYGQLMRKPQTIAYFLQINYWLKQYKVEVI
jgi:asparagine synthase (glutamine-hydrolysing)